jgi:hypothetical protein
METRVTWVVSEGCIDGIKRDFAGSIAGSLPATGVSNEEEIAWERAKARARGEYPEATGERFLSDCYGHLQENGALATPSRARTPEYALLENYERGRKDNV